MTLLHEPEIATPRREETPNAFELAQRHFDLVAETLDLDHATRDLLREPLREYHFSIPIRMDDGSRRVPPLSDAPKARSARSQSGGRAAAVH
ncbi:MAG TPA: hypothetical protein VEU30_08815 [Thermoanaerobaculia bacterium]|nr:hypothetical protein [Thermoanaerobaculia bacterium]